MLSYGNLWYLPKCNAINEFVAKLASMYNMVSQDQINAEYTLKSITVFCQLVLQKLECVKTKTIRTNIERRLKLWDDKNICTLLAETRIVQNRLKLRKPRNAE
ncbi:hypothetical protein GJ496_009176 [Pomphorhynchus laevis]|nr:hypothetical protein GJ496_009176 [Pomphorhynchus laevis]